MKNLLAYRIGSIQKPSLPLEQVAEMGMEGVEVVWNAETTAANVEAALKSSGLQMTSLCSACPLGDDDLPKRLEELAAQGEQLGAISMFVSAHAGDQMSKQEAYDRLRRLGDAVGKHRIYLSMETHPDLCQNATNMLETMAGVNHPWVGVNYDTANIYFYNENVDTVVELKKAAKSVRSVHLKDTYGGFRDGNFPVFGKGIVDFAAVAGVLSGVGFTGPYTMELEGREFDARKPKELAKKVAACVTHLRKVGVVG